MAAVGSRSGAFGEKRPNQGNQPTRQKLADLVSKFENLESKPKRPSVPSEVKLRSVNTKLTEHDSSSLTLGPITRSKTARIEVRDQVPSLIKSKSLYVGEHDKKASLHSSGITSSATWKLQPKVEVIPLQATAKASTSVAERRRAFEWRENNKRGMYGLRDWNTRH